MAEVTPAAACPCPCCGEDDWCAQEVAAFWQEVAVALMVVVPVRPAGLPSGQPALPALPPSREDDDR